MSPKAELRHRLIEELLETVEVASQTQLLALLAARGVPTTQPQLSRDLRTLHVAKEKGRYRLTERVTGLEVLKTLLRGARPAGPHLVVLHCEPGAASAVARALESERPAGLVGTVAGDDSVFVAVEAASHGTAIRQRIATLIS